MPEDVLEWGSGPGTPSTHRFTVPPAVPPILGGLAAVAFFASLLYPWQVIEIAAGLGSEGNAFTEYAITSGFGYAYLIGMMGLGALTTLALFGTRRHRRPATLAGWGLSGVLVLLLLSVIALEGKQISAVYIVGQESVTHLKQGFYLGLTAPVLAQLAMLASRLGSPRRRGPVKPVFDEEPDGVTDLSVTPVR